MGGGIVIAGIAAFTYPKWLHYLVPARRRSTPATPPTPVVVPAPAERQAWEIPGARRDEYSIYEAACLLTDEPVTWPLSPRAQDEYDAIMVWRPPVTVHGCRVAFPFRNFTVDHKVPQSKGGSDHFDNLQLLCGACNSTKGTGTQAKLLATLVRQARGTP